MTFREKLADWISGGALSVDRKSKEVYLNALLDARRKESSLWSAMNSIFIATADGKSGTARKIHRMAKEALGE